jgi:hypothetical protein
VLTGKQAPRPRSEVFKKEKEKEEKTNLGVSVAKVKEEGF